MLLKYRFFATCLLGAITYWLLESGVHLFFFGAPVFEFFPTDAHELWMRITVFVMFLLVGAIMEGHASRLVLGAIRTEALERQRRAYEADKQRLEDEKKQLEILVAERAERIVELTRQLEQRALGSEAADIGKSGSS